MSMQERIKEELNTLAEKRGIHILYACESGSRAWGFPSPDSDYDVRFIYVQEPNRYLSIYDKKDAIDLFLSEDLDLIGWDIRKALRLFHKSNASLFEWSQSPIVYAANSDFMDKFKTLAPDYFSPRACLHHYLGMTKHTYNGYLKQEEVNLKKYFYALRPLLCAKWIIEYQSIPPLAFADLLELVAKDSEIHSEIQGLLSRKEQSNEDEIITSSGIIQTFIEEELAACHERGDEVIRTESDAEALNAFFREILQNIGEQSMAN